MGRCAGWITGVLAGSVLAMDQAVRNFALFTGAGIATSAQCAGRNPARLMSLEQQWGCVEEGREANFVALAPDGSSYTVARAGRPPSQTAVKARGPGDIRVQALGRL